MSYEQELKNLNRYLDDDRDTPHSYDNIFDSMTGTDFEVPNTDGKFASEFFLDDQVKRRDFLLSQKNSAFDASIADDNNSKVKKTVIEEDANGNKVTTTHENKNAINSLKESTTPTDDVGMADPYENSDYRASLSDFSKSLAAAQDAGQYDTAFFGKGIFGGDSDPKYFKGDSTGIIAGLNAGDFFEDADNKSAQSQGYRNARQLGMVRTDLAGGFDPKTGMEYDVDGNPKFYTDGILAGIPLIADTVPNPDFLIDGRRQGDILNDVSDERKAEQESSFSNRILDPETNMLGYGFDRKTGDLEITAGMTDTEIAAYKAKKLAEIKSQRVAPGGSKDIDQAKIASGTFDDKEWTDAEEQDAEIASEEAAKKLLDKKENAAAKVELNKWLDSINKPGVTGEQAEVSAREMIEKATAKVPEDKFGKLKKALIIAAGSMLFGSSLSEALDSGFSVIGAQQEREDKLAAAIAKENREIEKALKIHAGKKIIDGPGDKGPFSGKIELVNIGTYANPVTVPLGQDAQGRQYVYHNGVRKLVRPGEYLPHYTAVEQAKAFSDNADSIKKEIIGTIKEMKGKREDREWNDSFSATLEGGNQIRGALNVYKRAGVNVESGINSYISEAISTDAARYMEYKRHNPNGKKRLAEFVTEGMINADVLATNSPSLNVPSVPVTAFILPNSTDDFPVKDEGMPEKAFADAQHGLNRYIRQQSRLPGEFKRSDGSMFSYKDLNKANNSQRLSLAYGAFKSSEKGMSDSFKKVSLERGYTPFMWWLISKK